ncbi:MAG: hypothetical protein OEL87_00435 [Nanoarchaeota archaeon]|nr:hypothetical protein [Nanoarchaeota archaeon]
MRRIDYETFDRCREKLKELFPDSDGGSRNRGNNTEDVIRDFKWSNDNSPQFIKVLATWRTEFNHNDWSKSYTLMKQGVENFCSECPAKDYRNRFCNQQEVVLLDGEVERQYGHRFNSNGDQDLEFLKKNFYVKECLLEMVGEDASDYD